ncbi:MAG: phytanoyl-CoA dioxygenase [Puniceicoccaceae bacterium]|nr:MAG: phytanoyl-CoA dioxygenase [Puniceicoccaceae bacterium]
MSAPAATVVLDSPYSLSHDQIARFREQGFIKLKHVLSPATIEAYRREITGLVLKLNRQTKPMEERTTYEKAFLQIINLWRHSDKVKEFVFSRRLARIAAELLEVDGVRLYHDQALYKEPGGGITPWHADQYYWPLGTDRTITAWIPLQETPVELGPLTFAAKSQNLLSGRDIAISDESEAKLKRSLRDYAVVEEPFDLGEVSYHLGWTFHRASPNTSDRPREVMTIIYMDKDIPVIEPERKAHQGDYDAFLKPAPFGGVPDGPLTPVLYQR